MGLKDLLVHVDNDAGCGSRLDVAATLAATHEAHLTQQCSTRGMRWNILDRLDFSRKVVSFDADRQQWKDGGYR